MVHRPVVDELPDLTGAHLDGGSVILSSLLGEGGFGKVYKALDVTTSSKASNDKKPPFYAVKCLLNPADPNDAYARVVRNELALHSALCGHPNIVTIHRTFVDESERHLFVVMDLADGDLFDEIVVKGSFANDDEKIRRAFVQILDAVKWCHDVGVAHGDIKPENILCDEDGTQMQLTDFGLATHSRLDDSGQGSSFYMSPELVGNQYRHADGLYSTSHCDIWALGVLLVNFVSKRNPWNLAENDDACFSQYLKDRNWLARVLPISSGLNEILKRALHINPLCRLPLSSFRQAILELNTFSKETERMLMISQLVRPIPQNHAARHPVGFGDGKVHGSGVIERSHPGSPSHKRVKKAHKRTESGSKKSPIPRFVSKFLGLHDHKHSPKLASQTYDQESDVEGLPTSESESETAPDLESTEQIRDDTVVPMVHRQSDEPANDGWLSVPRGQTPALTSVSSSSTSSSTSSQPITPPNRLTGLPDVMTAADDGEEEEEEEEIAQMAALGGELSRQLDLGIHKNTVVVDVAQQKVAEHVLLGIPDVDGSNMTQKTSRVKVKCGRPGMDEYIL